MTFTAKITTAALFAVVSILAALILSLGIPAMDVNAIELRSQHSTAQAANSSAPFVNGELYYSALKCTICPASLPPTSGDTSEVMTLAYIVSDAMTTWINSWFN
jgi:hypothetical protein